MSVEKFQDRDDDYLNWVKAHDTGYVINVVRSELGVAKLHSATCYTIINRPPFTGLYIKICSIALGDLNRWALEHPGAVVERCLKCQPAG
jgi:hypothetical protein